MPETLRLFIAIELPTSVSQALGALQTHLGSGTDRSAKWVAPAGIHLTLVFLGDVPSPRVPHIADALARAAQGAGPFSLHLAGAGCFPSLQRPRVIWVGLEGDTSRLAHLQRDVADRMERLGFPAERRPFTPHLTLARIRDTAQPDEARRLAEAVARLAVPHIAFTVTSIGLIRSELQPAGAVYTRLAESPLEGSVK